MSTALPELIASDAFGALDGVDTLVLLTVPGAESGELLGHGPSADLAAAYGIDIPSLMHRLGVTGEVGNICIQPLPPLVGDDRWVHLPGRLMFVGLGKEAMASPASDSLVQQARQAGGALARALKPGTVVAVAGLDAVSDGVATGFGEGVQLASYRHPVTGVKTSEEGAGQVRFIGADRAAIQAARRRSAVTVQARTWAATPSNIKNPAWLAKQVELSSKGLGVKVRVYDEKWIQDTGMGGLAAVGAGSATPPRFVVVEYTPKGRRPGNVAVVGKGITYDTGGLSIKPREAMVPMKTDMSGAAATLAAVLGAARARVNESIVAVLPLAENAVSSRSYRPGDIVTMVDGTTVEIVNTDAEGRIVLADAMVWARETYSPRVLVDVATLTGAATLGLGRIHGALYATTLGLRRAFLASGEASGEPLWPMPLVEEYRSSLETPVADLSHVPTPGVGGGSITAALFLQHFAGDTPWAHLDIAGPARATKTAGLDTEGATGFSARLLLHFLSNDPLGAALSV